MNKTGIDWGCWLKLVGYILIMIAVGLITTHILTTYFPRPQVLTCEQMANYRVDDLPVRCYEYYGLRLPE